jgi:hypothetical protein
MKHSINQSKSFEPITVEIIVESLAEAQELQSRLELSKKEVNDIVRRSGKFVSILNDGVAMTGIGPLRKDLHKLLGIESMVDHRNT